MVDAREVADHMIVSIASMLRDGERIFIGLNSYVPLLAAAVARIIHGKRLSIYTVAEAHNPELERIRLKQSTGDPALAATGTVFITVEAFDLVQKGAIDVMFLGPVQVDGETNINLSVIGSYEKPRVRLTGGAASAFIVPLIKRMIFWNTKHSKRGLVSRVDFVTATAKNSDNEVWLCTNLCCFRYDRSISKWVLEALHPWASVDDVRENTGFEFVVGNVSATRPPSEEEKALINTLDPDELRLKAFY